MSFNDLLIQVGDVLRYTSAGVDEAGQPINTWTVLHDDEPCRLASAGGREVMKDAVAVVAGYKCFCGDIDVTERDRWLISGATYEVLLVEAFEDSSTTHHKQCLLQVVR